MADDPKVETKEVPKVEDTQAKPTGAADQEKPPEAPQKGANGEPTYSKAEVENIVQKRLAAEQKASKDREEKAKKEAETEEAKKNGEYKKLAESLEAEVKGLREKVAELEPTDERAKRLEKSLKKHLEVARKGLPEHVIKLLNHLEVDQQLDYIAENAEALKPPAQEKPRGPAGSVVTPASAPGDKTSNVVRPPHKMARL